MTHTPQRNYLGTTLAKMMKQQGALATASHMAKLGYPLYMALHTLRTATVKNAGVKQTHTKSNLINGKYAIRAAAASIKQGDTATAVKLIQLVIGSKT